MAREGVREEMEETFLFSEEWGLGPTLMLIGTVKCHCLIQLRPQQFWELKRSAAGPRSSLQTMRRTFVFSFELFDTMNLRLNKGSSTPPSSLVTIPCLTPISAIERLWVKERTRGSEPNMTQCTRHKTTSKITVQELFNNFYPQLWEDEWWTIIHWWC